MTRPIKAALVMVLVLLGCQSAPPPPPLNIQPGQRFAVLSLIPEAVTFYDRGYLYDDNSLTAVDWGIGRWAVEDAKSALEDKFPVSVINLSHPTAVRLMAHIRGGDGVPPSVNREQNGAEDNFDYLLIFGSGQCRENGQVLYTGTGVVATAGRTFAGVGVFQTAGFAGRSLHLAHVCLIAYLVDGRTFALLRGQFVADPNGAMPLHKRSETLPMFGDGHPTEDATKPSEDALLWLKQVAEPMVRKASGITALRITEQIP